MDWDSVPLFLTPNELARITGMNADSIRRNIRNGKIPADRVNGKWIICKDNVFSKAKEARNGTTTICT